VPDLGDGGTKDWSCGDGVRDGLGVGGGSGVNTVRGSLSLQTAQSALIQFILVFSLMSNRRQGATEW